MRSLIHNPGGRVTVLAATVLALLAAGPLLGVPPPLETQVPQLENPSQIIGRIEGDDFAIEPDAVSPGIELAAASGELLSGAHVVVRSGQVRVLFEEGGGVAICGAARFQLLRDANTLTVVLEYGQIDVHLDAARAVSIFTPLIVATPISVGGGQRELLVGLGKSGDMCLRAVRGAARLQQQLSGQSLLVPQFGEISLTGGQVDALKSPAGACACSVEEAKFRRPGGPVTRQTLSALGNGAPKPPRPTTASPAHPPPPAPPVMASDQPRGTLTRDVIPTPHAPPAASSPQQPQLPEVSTPIYKVLAPPLTFDASAPTPPPLPSA